VKASAKTSMEPESHVREDKLSAKNRRKITRKASRWSKTSSASQRRDLTTTLPVMRTQRVPELVDSKEAQSVLKAMPSDDKNDKKAATPSDDLKEKPSEEAPEFNLAETEVAEVTAEDSTETE
jgi:hypothetical protein